MTQLAQTGFKQAEQRTAALTPLYQRYRLIAMATCIAVLVAGIIDALVGGVGPNALIRAPENVRFAVFLSGIGGLLALELTAAGVSSFRAEEPVSVGQLLTRGLLFTSVFVCSDILYSQMLFLVFLLYLYLGVNKWLSYTVAVLGCVALLTLGVMSNPVAATLSSSPRPAPPRTSPTPPTRTSPPRTSPPSTTSPATSPPSRTSSTPPPPEPTGLGRFLPPRPEPATLGRLTDNGLGLFVVVLFTFMLARSMSRAAADHETLKTLHDDLAVSHQQLQASSQHIAELAATEERNRLARDIHDSLGHHLAAINIQLEKASAYKTRDPEQADEAIAHAKRTVKDALKDVRESVKSLHQTTEAFSLYDALEELVARMEHSNLSIELEQTGHETGYSYLVLMTLYRVAQEGLTNVHKYADANEVRIGVNLGAKTATLWVTDTGQGFDVSAWETRFEQEGKTFGLQGLKERLNLVGGELCIHSEQGQGTTLTATVPKQGFQTSVLETASLQLKPHA